MQRGRQSFPLHFLRGPFKSVMGGGLSVGLQGVIRLFESVASVDSVPPISRADVEPIRGVRPFVGRQLGTLFSRTCKSKCNPSFIITR